MSKTANARGSTAAARSSRNTLGFFRLEIAIAKERARLPADSCQIHHRLTERRYFHQCELLLSLS